MTEGFYTPFEKATGVKIVRVTADHEPTSQIKAMVETKNYFWDVVVLSMGAYGTVAAQGLLDPLNVTAEMKEIPEKYRRPEFMGFDLAATNVIYSIDKFGDNGPQSWADFWNVEKFKGRRGMRRHPFDTLEEALLADGVPPAKLYPLDLPRAFKKLDQIRPHVAIWWTGGAQASQLIKSGEVDLIATWNGRAQAAIDDGAKYRIAWNQGIVVCDGLTVPEGQPEGGPGEGVHRVLRECRAPGDLQQVPVVRADESERLQAPAARADRDPAEQSQVRVVAGACRRPKAWAAQKDAATEQFEAWITKKA